MAEPIRIMGCETEEGIQARVNPDGSLVVSTEGGFMPSDLDESDADTKYYGFVDMDGRWYIMEKTATTVRYIRGTSAYTVYWGNRASNTYNYYYNSF